MEFHLLGAVTARTSGGEPIDLGPARQRCVLTVLLIDANSPVRTDDLIDRVWAGQTPTRVTGSLQSYLTRLRNVLPGIGITHQANAYTLVTDRQTIDLHRFRRLLGAARTAPEHEALANYHEAFALWRGEPFAGLDTPWLNTIRDTLRHQHRSARLDHTDLQLRLGQHAELLAELSTRAANHPLDERLAGQLMLALYRNGRQADALRHYRETRTRLSDELGVDPNPTLRELHQKILTADPTLINSTPPAGEHPVPRQLPAPPRHFAGRETDLAKLTRAMDTATGGARAVVISAIGGAGGIGKTWLALHWAHHNLHHFPDGQLFTNLHGFDPSGKPTPPETAIRSFLDGLGVQPAAIPIDLDAQTALYRSLVTGKHILILIDNAATADQVTPLLPGSSTCTVLITSRNRLAGLVSGHGAQPVFLDFLAEDDARALLATFLGAERLAGEPDAFAALLSYCAGLPLALSIVAGRAKTHPEFPLSMLADELREARLDALDDDPATSIRAVLSWSRAALDPQETKVFALLGLAAGPDIGLPAATSLTGLGAAETRTTIAALERISLVQQHVPGRYRMHDLVGLYAAEQAHQQLSTQERDEALRRLLNFYTHTAYLGDRLLAPHRPAIELGPPPQPAQQLPLSTRATAVDWFNLEHANIMAIQQLVARRGWHREVWRLAWSMTTFRWRQGNTHDDVSSWELGIAAATTLREPAAQALANRRLGHVYAKAGQHAKALDHLHEALSLAESVNDVLNQGHTHRAMASAYERQGADDEALTHANRALELFLILRNPVWEAQALNASGWYSARLGQYAAAEAACTAALEICRDNGDDDGAADIMDSLGYIAHHSGQFTESLAYYQESLALYRSLGHAYSAANTLDRLAETYNALGDSARARATWQQALRLYQQHHRIADAERIQQQLASLSTSP